MQDDPLGPVPGLHGQALPRQPACVLTLMHVLLLRTSTDARHFAPLESTNMTKLLSAQGIKVRTHHAAAPSRPPSGRRLSNSSSKRKVGPEPPGSATMIKTESSGGSSCDMMGDGGGGGGSLGRRDSTTSSKRPRMAGGLDATSTGGRPVSRPGSLHSAHEYDPRGPAPRPISWGPPPPAPSSGAAATGYPYGHGASQPAAASAGYGGYHIGGGAAAGDPTRAYHRDPREPWPQEPASHQASLSRVLDPRIGGEEQQRAVDLSRPTLPPVSALRGPSHGEGGDGSQYPRPPSSSGSISGGSNAFSNARHLSLGGGVAASESSAHRSSMSSVLSSERYSISSNRHPSLSSDPSSYAPSPSVFDHDGGRYPPGIGVNGGGGKTGLPSFQSLHDDSKRGAAGGQHVPFPTEGPHTTAFGAGSGGGGGGPPVLPTLSGVGGPRLPSLLEMMAQPSVQVGGAAHQRSLSPLGSSSASNRPAGQQQQQQRTSPERASSSRGGRMGLSDLLAD